MKWIPAGVLCPLFALPSSGEVFFLIFDGGEGMVEFDKVKKIGAFAEQSPLEGFEDFFSRFNKNEYVMFPGFCDVHVHFREPGFSYK